MDIGGIGGFGLGESVHSGVGRVAGELHGASTARLKVNHHASHEHGRHTEHHDKSRTSNILRQEIRQILSASFRLSFSTLLSAYATNTGDDSPADVAADTLSAARQLAARSPLEASNTLVSVRRKVEQAATSVRETLVDHDHQAIDETMNEVSDGLDDLDDDAARNVASSASVLSAETSLRQRSTIRIRTQEGDIVRLDLRRAERMSATDVAVTEGDNEFSATRVEVSSRTRSVLTVKGDLNEAELAAIQNIFAQAETIADEFFGGNLAAAFDMAAGLEFDTETLSKVNMRFRAKQVSIIRFAVVQPELKQPKVGIGSPAPGIRPVEPEIPTAVTNAVPAAVPAEPDAVPASAPAEPEVATAAPATEDNAIDSLAELLADFLRAVSEGFESGSFRYYYSESFKLEILKSVLQVAAPQESGEAANVAAAMIDAINS